MRPAGAAIRRIGRGLRSWPDREGWARVAGELAWGLPVIAALAWAGGLMRFDPAGASAGALTTLAILFVAPALGEELLFRGGLLDPARPSRARLVIAVALFVLWHPVQAIGFGPPWAGLFLDPGFLAAVAVLGAMLGRIYLRTASLWPCILVHWLVVAAWKLVFGGPF